MIHSLYTHSNRVNRERFSADAPSQPVTRAMMNHGEPPVKRNVKIGRAALILAGVIAALTALAHFSCIILGPGCYQAQMAPDALVQSAIDGTWIAPIGTLAISLIFMLCAIYALSAAGIIRRLPFLGLGVYCIGAICIFRGLATVPLSVAFPNMVSSFSISAGLVWFFTGLLFIFGYRHATQNNG